MQSSMAEVREPIFLSEAVGLDMAMAPYLDSAALDATGHIDPALFRAIFGAFAAGVTVVTTVDAAGVPIGVTVSAVMSLSLEPPQLLVALDSAKYTMRAIGRRGSFAVNFLGDRQHEIADRFARPAPDKFAGIEWDAGPALACPVFSGVRAFAECRVERLVRSGDHTLIIGRLVSGAVNDGSGLVYCDRRYRSLGDLAHLRTVDDREVGS
jgi:flavin reductase (DIM6/NTAB) family NADH-FMN oxidoreductase RutF